MNAAQAHLALNHLPVLLPLVGIVVLAAGMYRRSEELKKAGPLFLIVAGIAAIPTYLSGEPAEAIAKNYPGVSSRNDSPPYRRGMGFDHRASGFAQATRRFHFSSSGIAFLSTGIGRRPT